MFKKIKISLAVLGLLISSSSFAEKYFDGHQVLQMCQAQSQEMSAGCAMFIVGSAESLRMVGLSENKYCLSSDVNNRQLREQFVGFLMGQKPEALNYSAASLFYVNLIKNHPCQKQ